MINTNYLQMLNEAAKAARKTKTTADAATDVDFYDALQTAIPGYTEIKRDAVSAIKSMTGEASSLLKDNLPEGLSEELDVIASQRNRNQGRHGTAGEFSRIKLRATERQRLRSQVAPELLNRAMALMGAVQERFTPRHMDFMQAYGMHVANLMPLTFVDKGTSMAMADRRREANRAWELGNATLDLRAAAFNERKKQNQKTRDWNEDQDKKATKFENRMLSKLRGDVPSKLRGDVPSGNYFDFAGLPMTSDEAELFDSPDKGGSTMYDSNGKLRDPQGFAAPSGDSHDAWNGGRNWDIGVEGEE